jgi:hypothetical protein
LRSPPPGGSSPLRLDAQVSIYISQGHHKPRQKRHTGTYSRAPPWLTTLTTRHYKELPRRQKMRITGYTPPQSHKPRPNSPWHNIPKKRAVAEHRNNGVSLMLSLTIHSLNLNHTSTMTHTQDEHLVNCILANPSYPTHPNRHRRTRPNGFSIHNDQLTHDIGERSAISSRGKTIVLARI